MRALTKAALGSGVALFCLCAAAGTAAAAPCDDIDNNGQPDAVPVIYIENGDTQEPLLKRIGRQLIASQNKVRIVYRNRPTCELATNFYGTRNLAPVANRPIKYIPDEPTAEPIECEPAGTPQSVELAIGATYLSSCPTLPAMPADTAVVNGPNQAYGFIVPKASSQIAITAEEGYLAFGFPEAEGDAQPWTVQNLRFIRGTTASTTLTTSANIGLTAGQMKAVAQTTSLILLNAVKDAVNVEATIGTLGTELFDQDRSLVKFLAFKGFKQKYAYYPDATSTSYDKQNVRDGHYLPWSPTPYIYVKDGAGDPADARVKRVVELLFGKRAEADVDGLKQVVDSGLVPQCAMKVKRDLDGGPLSLFSPAEPCGCYFEAHVPQGATTCTACTGDGNCNGGKCRYGYCEAK